MRNAHDVFNEIRQILGTDVVSVHQTATPTASAPFSDHEMADWLSALQGNDLLIPWTAEARRLYGNVTSLEKGQIGYSTDTAGKPLPDWPDDWIVLGEISSDPIIGRIEQNHCAILFARHGAGSWQANPVSNDILTFAEALLIWCDLFVRRYAMNVYDDTLAVQPAFLAELRQRVGKMLSNAETDVFMNMVDG
jgi:hypothetical protein